MSSRNSNNVKFVTLRNFDNTIKTLAKKDEVTKFNYKSLVLQVTQTGTNNPSLIVYEDTINIPYSLVRSDVGIYHLVFTDPIANINKVFILTDTINIGTLRAYVSGSNAINIETYKFTANLTTGALEASSIDEYLTRAMIEIRIYN